MATPRFFLPMIQPHARRVELTPEAAHHAMKVLRLQTGAGIVLFDGTGGEYPAFISAMGRQGVSVEIGPWCEREAESPLRVTLAQAIPGGDKMDYVLQKATELGVFRIQPLSSERSIVRLSPERAEKRVHHWQKVVNSACEQCGRNRVPEVAPILALGDWLGSLADSEARISLAPGAAQGLHQLAPPSGPLILLTGPEGGFSSPELRAVESRGFTSVHLGPRVLRTETAALVALAAMQTLWGDF